MPLPTLFPQGASVLAHIVYRRSFALRRYLVAGAALATAVLIPSHAEEPATFGGSTPTAWSGRLADSEMKRLGHTLELGGAPKARWDYAVSVFALGLVRYGEAVKCEDCVAFGTRAVASFVQPDGTIQGYKLDEYNIDNVTPGRVLLAALARGEQNEAWTKALHTLREQMATHPRTSDGGFWHKKRYPHQMWLDGLFMASPFLAQYAGQFREPALFDDVAQQIILMDRHGYDAATGLYWHAWDEAHAQSWANPQTGTSPNFWSRSIGWYAMAIVDTLDYLPVDQPELDQLVQILGRVADGIVKWQDPKSGAWWQVTNLGDRPGNYLESTASSMFVYSLAKAVNKGYLPREKYLPAIRKGYEGLIRTFIKENADGTIRLTQCCSVAGLGYTNAAGRTRDGSFDYYVSEPIVDNDLKGTGPFLLAGLEVEKLLSTTSAKTTSASSLRVTGWSDLPAVLARIQAPTFPARDFPISDFGAKAGADVTVAIRDAIAACHAAGGGRVVVPAGEWLTGAVHLLSNVNLHVSQGAVLKFSTNPADYPTVFTRWEGVECYNYSPFIYALDQQNIAVTGTGTLDGQCDWNNWWGWNKKRWDKASQADRESHPPEAFIQSGDPLQKADRDALFQLGEANVPVEKRVFGPGHYLRPNFIQPVRCQNILIEGVTILRSPMWELHPLLSQNITIRGVKIKTHGPNNDGFDPESCRDMLVEDTVFDTGDDCIAIKAGRNNDGRRVNLPTENIVIRRCTMRDGHGGVVLGSECTGGIRNVFVEDCEMDSANLDRAFRFKNNAVRGGVLENFFARNVKIGRVTEAVLTIDLLYEEGAKGAFQPIVRNIQLERIESSASPRVMFIRGFEGAIVDGLRVTDSVFNNVSETEVVQHAGRITFDRVTITPAKATRSLNSVPSSASK